MKKIKKELFSEHLKNLEKDLEKINKAEKYLEIEKRKLINQKETIRVKIKKEKEILELKQKIERVKNN